MVAKLSRARTSPKFTFLYSQIPSRSAYALPESLEAAISPKSGFDFLHDLRDRLVAQPAIQPCPDRGLQRLEPCIPPLIAYVFHDLRHS